MDGYSHLLDQATTIGQRCGAWHLSIDISWTKFHYKVQVACWPNNRCVEGTIVHKETPQAILSLDQKDREENSDLI